MVNPAETDSRVAEILADQVRLTARARGWVRPHVILVDHGSPQPSVAVVRNHLGAQLRALLGETVAGLAVASQVEQRLFFASPPVRQRRRRGGWRSGREGRAACALRPHPSPPPLRP
jgi:hypothetical protein